MLKLIVDVNVEPFQPMFEWLTKFLGGVVDMVVDVSINIQEVRSS